MKKNISIKLLALMLSVMMVLSLTACGGKEAPSAGSEKAPASSSSSEAKKPEKEEPKKEEEKKEEPKKEEPKKDEEIAPRVFQIEKIDAARQINTDTAGWLYIPNTKIDDPVMQGVDNDEYLRITETRQPDIFGCYFVDFRNPLDYGREYMSKNTIIYGHSDYKDNPEGKKFSQLFHYAKDIDFVRNNPYIYFSTGEEDLVWKVFAVFYTHIDFNYIQTDPTDEEFMKIIEEAVAKSEYIIDEEITKDDKILTVSTCTGLFKQPKENYRMAIMAKLMPSNEIPLSEMTMKVEPNPNPLRD